MATIAHFIVPLLAGLALKLEKLSLAAMIFFAMLPDVDVLMGFVFMGSPFALHRGFTHSLVFACVPLAGYLACRRKELFFGFLGELSHPLIEIDDKGESRFSSIFKDNILKSASGNPRTSTRFQSPGSSGRTRSFQTSWRSLY
ncbi:LexA-binding, inner membrane-associated putative hydrolase [uncultured archaeon]|nr:LexA-binding, inner membrane-associated putative hydrolase [uncultured archaeon]